MNVMIDTNVILDDVLNREPRREAAAKIIRMANTKKIFGYITANTLTDIYYIINKHLDEVRTRYAIRKLLNTLQIIAVDGQDCRQALDLPIGDFEDALVAVCAEKAELDYIVTNDQAFLAVSDLRVPLITPDGFIKQFVGGISS